LKVRNIEQAAAYQLELCGQISDGHWENARPGNHYIPWCECEVEVAKDGEPVGRNFHASRTSYNLTDASLLGVVGKRMLGAVRLTRALGIEVAKAHEYDIDLDGGLQDTSGFAGPYWEERRTKMAATGTDKLKAALADESYTMKDLRKDLNDLKQIMKVRI